VTPEDAEEVILGDPLDIGFEVVNGEERWSYIGETSAERILRVVITLRGKRMRVPTTTIRLDPEDIAEAREQAAERGLRYQTYLKMIIREALRAAKAARKTAAL
jgi:predicted DNA binding CopG/RHH family protein